MGSLSSKNFPRDRSAWGMSGDYGIEIASRAGDAQGAGEGACEGRGEGNGGCAREGAAEATSLHT